MDGFNYNLYNTTHYYSYSQTPQGNGQYAFQPQAGQISAGAVVSGASGSYPASGQPYLNPNTPAQIPPLFGSDWEYSLRPQPTPLEEIFQPQPIAVEDIQNAAPQELPNPQPAVEKRRGRPPKGQSTAKQRFLEGLEAYGRGVALENCSSSLRFRSYINDNGLIVNRGIPLYDELTSAEKTRLDQAIIARKGAKLIRIAEEDTVTERFLEGLNHYAQGAKLKECSATLPFRSYVSDDGRLQKPGLDVYAGLPPEGQERVNKALTARRELIAQRTSEEVDKFMATLEPYANGLSLLKCGNLSGLKWKATEYLTRKGGLRTKGELLVDKLRPDQRNKVFDAIAKRLQSLELNPQVPEPAWQWPVMPSPISETGGMNLTAMADPILLTEAMQMETMQTEAMWATVWQLTGQAVPGPSESAEPSIPYYDSEAVGLDFQYQYGATD
jgi:hypothetical protein